MKCMAWAAGVSCVAALAAGDILQATGLAAATLIAGATAARRI